MTEPQTFFDGKSAKAQSVLVSLAGGLLEIIDSSSKLRIASWPIEDIILYSNKGASRLRLGLREDNGARLVFSGSILPAELDHLDLFSHEALDRPGNRKLVTMSAIGVLGLVLFVMVGLPSIAGALAPFVPDRYIGYLGRQVYEAKKVEWPHCKGSDPIADAALLKLTKKVVAGTDLKSDDLNVGVFRTKLENAFALPGGYIIITSALLEKSSGPDEIAGILAHELGHIHHDHPTKGMLEGIGVGILLDSLIGDFTGSAAIGTMMHKVLNATYTRDKERQADQYALDVMQRVGIHASGMQKFFQRLSEEKEEPPALLNTHPLSEDRVAFFDVQIDANTKLLAEHEWQALKEICTGVTRIKDKNQEKDTVL